jgi:hypothetical protein
MPARPRSIMEWVGSPSTVINQRRWFGIHPASDRRPHVEHRLCRVVAERCPTRVRGVERREPGSRRYLHHRGGEWERFDPGHGKPTRRPRHSGAFSLDGKRIVFVRFDQDGNSAGLFTVRTDGSDLRQLTPMDMILNIGADWSPEANEILLSRHVSSDVHGSLWVVHADGTGLREECMQLRWAAVAVRSVADERVL